MGYQESFIYTSARNMKANHRDIEKILDIFQKYNIRCADDFWAECVCKLHFNEAVPPFKKGMEMLVICGDRTVQRGYAGLFAPANLSQAKMNPTKDEIKVMKKVTFLSIENALQICEAENTPKITVEQLDLNPKSA